MTISPRELLATNPDMACSGGAIGADTVWGDTALGAGHNVLHFSFAGHNSDAAGVHVKLTLAQLLRANEHLHRANTVLQRAFPTRSPFANNLLRRNWYQIRRSKRFYAVAPLVSNMRGVDGGTGWALQMWLDQMGPRARRTTWVWCLTRNRWFEWEWDCFAPVDMPPRPEGVYAAVGSRNVNPAAVGAIEDLYRI